MKQSLKENITTSNHNFKVGDKVKLRGSFVAYFPDQGTKEGKVVSVSTSDTGYIRVMYNGYKYLCGFPYKHYEIELVTEVGKQLEFSFMR